MIEIFSYLRFIVNNYTIILFIPIKIFYNIRTKSVQNLDAIN